VSTSEFHSKQALEQDGEMEINMNTKKFVQLVVVIMIVSAAFVNVGSAFAWGGSGCSGRYYVQWGDTLSGLASQCGTSIYAIRAANPGLGSWLYAGQVIYLPSSSYGYSNNGYYNNSYYNNGYYQQPYQYQQQGRYRQGGYGYQQPRNQRYGYNR
jgi:LysM domain